MDSGWLGVPRLYDLFHDGEMMPQSKVRDCSIVTSPRLCPGSALLV